MLTIERLLELLTYDENSGKFTWKVPRRGNVVAGSLAGHIEKDGYVYIKIDGRKYLAHRLAWLFMTGAFPLGQIDHSNMCRSYNRWCNLRDATASQNQANVRIRKDNKSGFKGVYWATNRKKWHAQITIDKRVRFLGYFDDPSIAHSAYIAAAKKHFGEFARAL
jgi:HNH endonuclease